MVRTYRCRQWTIGAAFLEEAIEQASVAAVVVVVVVVEVAVVEVVVVIVPAVVAVAATRSVAVPESIDRTGVAMPDPELG